MLFPYRKAEVISVNFLCVGFNCMLQDITFEYHIFPNSHGELQAAGHWVQLYCKKWHPQRPLSVLSQAYHSFGFGIVHGHIILQVGVYLLHGHRAVLWIFLPLLWSRQDNRNRLFLRDQSHAWGADLC